MDDLNEQEPHDGHVSEPEPEAAEGSTVVKGYFGGLSPKEASRRSVEARKAKSAALAGQRQAEKRRQRDLAKQVQHMSQLEFYREHLAKLADETPIEEWAEGAIRKVIGGILVGDIDVKGSNAAGILDSLWKIAQLAKGQPTSITKGEMTPEERREAMAVLRDAANRQRASG